MCGGIVAEIRDVLEPDLELTALVRPDPSKLQIVSKAEVSLCRQLRRGWVGGNSWLSIDGERRVAEPQVSTEIDVLDSPAHTGGVPIEKVADIDGFALVVAASHPGRPSVKPRNALDVGVEIGEGQSRTGRGRELERRIDDPRRRIANIGRRY